MSWAINGSLRALASLPLAHVAEEAIAIALTVGLLVALAAWAAASPTVRARLRTRGPWIAWGAAWFAAGALALTPIFPLWQPNRAHFASAGAGVAAAAALEAAHPALAGALVLGRGVLLVLAPPAAHSIAEDAPDAGAFMDFARLSRLQRFMSITRHALQAQYPHAVPHAHLVEMNLPRGLMYALGENRAVQVWYRDTTLTMVNFTRVAQDSTLSMLAGVQFQPKAEPAIVLLSPEAMSAQDRGYRRIVQGAWDASFAPLALADSLTPDASVVVFHADNAGYRAFALLQLRRYPEAEAEARRSLALVRSERNGLLVLGSVLAIQGRFDEALAHVDNLLRLETGNEMAQRLRASIVARRDAAAPR
jgi:tetratricopeptide (TPR) repeat protein